MDIFKLYRYFWDFAFSNPELIKPNHCAVYSFSIEHCNRLGWKAKFGFPSSMAMEATGIKSYSVYKKTFDDLVEYGFFTVIQYSKNQYSSNIIALKENYKALDKALDKALTTHLIKHDTKQSESTVQSIDSIIKPTNKKPINLKPINNTDSEKKEKIEIQKIEGSEYGDGELHFLIDEFARKNHNKYPNDMYHLFLLYWTATVLNGSGKGKELWKTQTTFSLAGRLAMWSSKSYNNSNQKPQNNYGTAKDRERAELDKRGAELNEMFKQYYDK